MHYSVVHNGVTCALPKLTMGVKKEINEISEKISNVSIPLDTRIGVMYEFLQESVGEECLAKALGAENLDEADMNDVNILYLKIVREYDRPLEEFKRPEIRQEDKKVMQELDKVAKSIAIIQQASMKK